MTLLDLADNIYRELDIPVNLSIPQISYWLQTNIGMLNIVLAPCDDFPTTNKHRFPIGAEYFTIINHECSPELWNDEANIFKSLYIIKYYTSQINQNLGATAYDWSEVSEGDSRVRRVSKNEIAKTYIQLRKDLRDETEKLVNIYWQNRNLAYSKDFPIRSPEYNSWPRNLLPFG